MGESVVEPGQHMPGAGGLFSLALDLDAVAARRNINAQPVFQRYQILVIFAEQLSQRSEEHTSELQSLMRISYAVFCLKKKKTKYKQIIRLRLTHKHRNKQSRCYRSMS